MGFLRVKCSMSQQLEEHQELNRLQHRATKKEVYHRVTESLGLPPRTTKREALIPQLRLSYFQLSGDSSWSPGYQSWWQTAVMQ